MYVCRVEGGQRNKEINCGKQTRVKGIWVFVQLSVCMNYFKTKVEEKNLNSQIAKSKYQLLSIPSQ